MTNTNILLIALIILAIIIHNCIYNNNTESFSTLGAKIQLRAKDPQDLYLTDDALQYIPKNKLKKFPPYYNLIDEDGWVDFPFYRLYP